MWSPSDCAPCFRVELFSEFMYHSNNATSTAIEVVGTYVATGRYCSVLDTGSWLSLCGQLMYSLDYSFTHP